MRPTSLHFRSPKEKTAEFYTPHVTYDGRRIRFPAAKCYNVHRSTFSKEPRFLEYALLEKQSNTVVAPTTYNPLQSIIKITKKPCLVSYKPVYHVKAVSEAYTMIGDQIMYEPALASKTELKSKERLGVNGISPGGIKVYGKVKSRPGTSTNSWNRSFQGIEKAKARVHPVGFSRTLTRPFTTKGSDRTPKMTLHFHAAHAKKRSTASLSTVKVGEGMQVKNQERLSETVTAGRFLFAEVNDYLRKNYQSEDKQ